MYAYIYIYIYIYIKIYMNIYMSLYYMYVYVYMPGARGRPHFQGLRLRLRHRLLGTPDTLSPGFGFNPRVKPLIPTPYTLSGSRV